jgi:hypothetical protein
MTAQATIELQVVKKNDNGWLETRTLAADEDMKGQKQVLVKKNISDWEREQLWERERGH